MLTKLSKQLKNFGLSDNEVAVYIALLSHGSDTAANISKKSNLNRSTTYVQLDTLMNHGLVSSFKKGKKTFFSPESPHNVKRLINARIKELENERDNIEALIPGLNDLYAEIGEAPDIKTFEGKEGLKTMREAVLASGEKEFYAAFNTDDLYRILSDEELRRFSKTRSDKKMKSHIIYSMEKKAGMQLVPPQQLLRVNPKKYPMNADIYIYGNTVSLASTSGKIFGISIKNEHIASSLRSVFRLAADSENYISKDSDLKSISNL